MITKKVSLNEPSFLKENDEEIIDKIINDLKSNLGF